MKDAASRVAEGRFAPRERQFLELRARGLSYKEIAAKLGLAPGSIKIRLFLAARRLGIDTGALVAEYQRRERIDYMRLKAIEIMTWLRLYGAGLDPKARAAMEGIMANMVEEVKPTACRRWRRAA